MLYRTNPKNGDKLSQLGFGCMRFSRKGAQIDQEKATELIKSAIEQGVNYFDTAYIYPGSEISLGTALAKLGVRDKVKIASKLPLIMCKSAGDLDKFFNKQLERLKTDRIDYYLMHMLCDVNTWEKLKSFGVIEWIKKKKESGQIINIGFSYHGGRTEFRQLIDAYGWDFCMIQYNYMDEKNQAGHSGLKYASQKGLPVFVMEPLRGGMLVNGLPKEARAEFYTASKTRTLAEWGLRWVWNHPEVTLLLSGMSDFNQLNENIKIAGASPENHLSEKELKVYNTVLKEINRTIKIPCTSCGYCQPCPKNVDIPTCFSNYNEYYTGGSRMGAIMKYMQVTGGMSATKTNASNCVKCGKCESHCPQGIEISKRLDDVSKIMEPAWTKPVVFAVRKFLRLK